jgi:hypothetical protein
VVKIPKIPSTLFSAFAWAIFTLGATQLSLVLAGPAWFFIAMVSSGILFSVFLAKSELKQNRSHKTFVTTYLLATTILFAVNSLYLFFVLVQPDLSLFLFQSLLIFLFLFPLMVMVLILRKPRHVAR